MRPTISFCFMVLNFSYWIINFSCVLQIIDEYIKSIIMIILYSDSISNEKYWLNITQSLITAVVWINIRLIYTWVNRMFANLTWMNQHKFPEECYINSVNVNKRFSRWVTRHINCISWIYVFLYYHLDLWSVVFRMGSLLAVRLRYLHRPHHNFDWFSSVFARSAARTRNMEMKVDDWSDPSPNQGLHICYHT